VDEGVDPATRATDEHDVPALRLAAGSTLVIALASGIPAGWASAECSPSALDAVRTELRGATAPDCGPKSLRRAFTRACERASTALERAILQCAVARAPHIARAHDMLLGVLGHLGRPGTARRLLPPCTDLYIAALETLDDDLHAAASDAETTTTTSPPGTPTTTTAPQCVTVTLQLDRGDCTRVTSEPPRLVDCDSTCDLATFTLPASGPLRLNGTPAPGDDGVTFDGDCEDDGTVDLADASPPDCSLSCDCSSGQ
jgi:hypothetical protein